MDAWYDRHDPAPAPGKTLADPDLNTSDWKTINQPTPGTRADIPVTGDQVVWFRRTFDLPADWAGKDLMLHLGPVNDEDTTFVNGVRVGSLYHPWQSRDYGVPASALKPGRNVIAIRVLNQYGDVGMAAKPEQLNIGPANDPSAAPLSLAGPWLYFTKPPMINNDPSLSPIDNDINQPSPIFNGMVAPLIPFGFKGILWYQGEFNAWAAKLYQTQLPTMIQDWRSRWGEGDFPFLIVQLANIGPPPTEPGKSPWAELREAQLLTAEHVPNTGLAVAVDIGAANDIHPHNKQEVGRRLALAAEAIVYGKKVEYAGPIYQSMAVEGGAIRLSFRHVGGGLVAKGADKLTGFAIAGADGKFVWADAKIDGQTVVVSAPEVPAPMAVRYAWADNPVCNLTNQAGLPASPFRTDK
jgi:sialate O-acetylesterase